MPVAITTATSGWCSRIQRVRSVPDSPGMLTSQMTTENPRRASSRRASAASAAASHSHSPPELTMRAIIWRTASSSSTISTRSGGARDADLTLDPAHGATSASRFSRTRDSRRSALKGFSRTAASRSRGPWRSTTSLV